MGGEGRLTARADANVIVCLPSCPETPPRLPVNPSLTHTHTWPHLTLSPPTCAFVLAAAREAVEATHFRKELIIWADERVADGAQGLWRLREAGYAHVLGVLVSSAYCTAALLH